MSGSGAISGEATLLRPGAGTSGARFRLGEASLRNDERSLPMPADTAPVNLSVIVSATTARRCR
jgi:hypothetical protein